MTMILAAHHPSYLPLPVFLYKMFHADVFVLTDDFQYSTQSQINRAKIKTVLGPKWLTVPVRTKGRGEQTISEVAIARDQHWQRQHWKTLCLNYSFAPYFGQFAEQLEEIYAREWLRLFDLNLTLIEFFMHSLDISAKIVLSSALNLTGDGTSKLIQMTEQLDCDTYFVEMKYKDYLSRERFARSHKSLEFFTYEMPRYHQQFGEFVAGLSSIDLLFNEGKAAREMLV